MRTVASSPIVAAVALLIASASLAEDPVYFADLNLKAAVEETLGKTNPTPTDMLSLTTLECIGRGVTSLTGLQVAYNLEILNVAVNQISDIGPLAGLTTLSILDLDENRVTNLDSLSGLTNLSRLYLWGNQVSSLDPLAGLVNLSILDLNRNQVADLDPLSGLTNLSQLSLHSNQISSINEVVPSVVEG